MKIFEAFVGFFALSQAIIAASLMIQVEVRDWRMLITQVTFAVSLVIAAEAAHDVLYGRFF